MKYTRKKALVLVALLLFTMIFVSGCVSQPQSTIKSEQQVGEAVTDISEGVESVSGILSDIDDKIG